MNEIIEELWKHYMCNPLVEGGYTKKDGFKQAIQTACKAQRNACARVYERDYIYKGGYSVHDCIVDAEIERCDYE